MNNPSPLIGAPLAPTMFKLAVPGVIGAVLTTMPGLLEATFLKESGTGALAAVALVYPLVILSGMFSAGAFGGAISGFIARAIGAGNDDEASAVLVCAVIISLAGGFLMWILVVLLGPFLYQYASDSPTITNAAHYYATLLFPAIPAYWLVNMLSSVLRGSGDMIRPAIVAAILLATYILCASLLIPTQGATINEALKGAAIAMASAYLLASALVTYFIAHKSQPVRFRIAAFRPALLTKILRQGTLAASQSVMTIVYALVTTIIFSRFGLIIICS